jgi:hypothetical protein
VDCPKSIYPGFSPTHNDVGENPGHNSHFYDRIIVRPSENPGYMQEEEKYPSNIGD